MAILRTESANTVTMPTPALSPTATAVDLSAPTLPKVATTSTESHVAKLSQRKKWSLLLIFSLAFFIDSKSLQDSANNSLVVLGVLCLYRPDIRRPRRAVCAAIMGYHFLCCDFLVFFAIMGEGQ